MLTGRWTHNMLATGEPSASRVWGHVPQTSNKEAVGGNGKCPQGRGGPASGQRARTLGSTRAPALMRYLTASRWLFSAASISGVLWSSEQLSMLAPAC